MSWEQRPGDGTHEGQPVTGVTGAPQGPPNVYHPYTEATPEYGRYADPATAHGWQNAYDETRELPRLTPDGYGPGPAAPEGGSRHRRRSAPRTRVPGRVLMAVGALGAVGVAAAIAGSFGSGSGGSTPGSAGESARPKAARSTPATDDSPSAASTSAPVEPSRSVAPAAASAPPTASVSQAPATPSAAPSTSTAAPTGEAPSAPPSVSASPSESDIWPGRPGHGHGRHP
ncbi:hypothetical protein ABZ876_02060 [Streptomyces sp. NPDC046931]|uniref:hypothetical protein n=1 Tax=Streptomyces sp. NPDC046931 TaxID=3154806 RepID=UPI0033C4AC24